MRQLLWVASFLWQLSASLAEGTMLHFENFKVHLKNWLLCYVKHIYTFPPHYFNCLARSLFVVFTKINIYISIFYAFYHLRCWVLKEIDYEQNVKKVPTSKDVLSYCTRNCYILYSWWSPDYFYSADEYHFVNTLQRNDAENTNL